MVRCFIFHAKRTALAFFTCVHHTIDVVEFVKLAEVGDQDIMKVAQVQAATTFQRFKRQVALEEAIKSADGHVIVCKIVVWYAHDITAADSKDGFGKGRSVPALRQVQEYCVKDFEVYEVLRRGCYIYGREFFNDGQPWKLQYFPEVCHSDKDVLAEVVRALFFALKGGDLSGVVALSKGILRGESKGDDKIFEPCQK